MCKFISLVLKDGRNVIVDATGIEVSHTNGEDRVIVETRNKTYNLTGGIRTFHNLQTQLGIFIKNPLVNNARSKQVYVNGEIFPSVSVAASSMGISQSALSLRLTNPTKDLYLV